MLSPLHTNVKAVYVPTKNEILYLGVGSCKGPINHAKFEEKKQKIMYKIFRLHEQLKMGVEVLKELDRYIYVWAMIKNNHPVLTESNIDHFIIQKNTKRIGDLVFGWKALLRDHF